MDRAIPIVGTPKLTAYDLLLWEAELHAIKADRTGRRGVQIRSRSSMRTVADIHALALETPGYRAQHTTPREFQKFLTTTEQNTMRGFDSNNWVRQLEAMLGHDVLKSFAGDMQRAAAAVKARVLVIVGLQDHMVNPQPALAFARLLQAPTLELDSDCGHLITTCENQRIAASVARFLAE